MYRVLLRDVLTGEKTWHEDCYINGVMTKNKVIFLGDDKVKNKIVAWKWMGHEPTPKSTKYNKYCLIADEFLSLFAPLPDEWTVDLKGLHLKDIINQRAIEDVNRIHSQG